MDTSAGWAGCVAVMRSRPVMRVGMARRQPSRCGTGPRGPRPRVGRRSVDAGRDARTRSRASIARRRRRPDDRRDHAADRPRRPDPQQGLCRPARARRRSSGSSSRVAGWLFLELTVRMQPWVYQDLPSALGFASTPAVVAAAGPRPRGRADRLRHRPAAGPRRPSPGRRPRVRTADAARRCCRASCWRRSPASGSASCSARRRR